MPDLGKYALEVGLAYGLSILCLAVLVAVSLLRAARIRRALDRARGARGRPRTAEAVREGPAPAGAGSDA